MSTDISYANVLEGEFYAETNSYRYKQNHFDAITELVGAPCFVSQSL